MGSTSRGIGAAKPRSGNKDSIKFDEVIGMFDFMKHPNEHVRVRLLEKGLLAVKRHWCKIIAGNQKKEVSVPRFCVDFNPMNENEPHNNGCPYCKVVTKDRETSPVTNEFFYLTNAIVRDIQEEEPSKKADYTKDEKKTGFKDMRSKSWTPVRVLRLTSSMVGRMQELGDQNTKTDKDSGKKKRYDISHAKNGIDVNIKYKPKAAGTDKYSIDAVGKRSPITKEEDKYLTYNLTEELLDLCGRMDPKQAKEDFKRMELVGGEEIDDNDDDDDAIPVGKKKKKKGRDAFDDDDDDAPKKKKKKKGRDDDEDEDDEEDDEDDEPKSKKSKKSKKAKAGVVSKKSKKSKKDDDEDDEDEDDEDDEPKSKKKSSKKSKPVEKKKSKKSKKDDDEDEDDEDDEPAPKKKKKKPAKEDKKSKKGKKKSKSKLDDDDTDW